MKNYLTVTAWCTLNEWTGGLIVQAVNAPFRAVTPGQVRENLKLLYSLKFYLVCSIL